MATPGVDTPSERWLTPSNLLSLSRLFATPVLMVLILQDAALTATILLMVMGATDFLDGYIARATDSVSELGVVLDPVSDRVMVMGVLVALLIAGTVPSLLGAAVLLRDAVLSVAFIVLAKRGFGRPRVRKVGKTATFLLLAALPALVAGGFFRGVGLALFALGGLLYYVAAYRYVEDVRAWLGRLDDPVTG